MNCKMYFDELSHKFVSLSDEIFSITESMYDFFDNSPKIDEYVVILGYGENDGVYRLVKDKRRTPVFFSVLDGDSITKSLPVFFCKTPKTDKCVLLLDCGCQDGVYMLDKDKRPSELFFRLVNEKNLGYYGEWNAYYALVNKWHERGEKA